MTDEDRAASPAVRGDRFSGGPAREFMSSIDADRRIFEADLAVDRAHVVMLAEREILDDGDAGQILAALDAIEESGYDALPDGEDVHEAIETAVIDRIGPAGGRMHTARSRNDEVATCLRLALRDGLLDLQRALVEARRQLIALAEAHRETLIPGYTHRQPAQPTTVAHWALSYESALARDTGRIRDAYERTNRSPLGAAAFAGTPFDIDRERTATLLGFEGVVENATDAVAARDAFLEATAAATGVAITLSGLAADTIEFASDGLIALDDDYASTSSIMPQKKNPDSMELVRARAGDATGGFAGLATTLAGLPRGYNRDLQRADRHAWQAIDAVTDALPVAIGAVATADWPADVDAGTGFGTATGVADRLAMAGVPFRTAHEIVAQVAGDGTPSVEALLDAIDDALDERPPDLDRETLDALLDPAESVASRDSRGGPAPTAVAASIDRAVDRLDRDADALDDARDAVADAASRRQEAVDSYV
ncbi:argininosuccinate lyase [Halococcoides cellulosivorans]|uniref:Argininosuccinate lyase n=1 Tax=Halococcoides cellulosivorans TaxID=1679096 RepID=A0A2R4X476_9EURY|nr:argininosuccinate lyase [Halococcoides cellulosivorans]AWB28589.1 argininosuccinate lyase [Halococcoides cellulosivorans]